jgi:hypothetical protein
MDLRRMLDAQGRGEERQMINKAQVVSAATEAGYLELRALFTEAEIGFLQRFAARVLMTEEALQRIERKRHAAWMEEAADEIQHWGEQAGERTQQRYGLKSTVDDFRGRAAALRARVEG